MDTKTPSDAADASFNFPRLISHLLSTVDDAVSVAKALDTGVPALTLFASLVEQLKPILDALLQQSDANDLAAVRPAVDSLNTELRRAQSLVRHSAGSAVAARLIEDSVHRIGRCLGLVQLVWAAAPDDVREGMAALHKEMITAQFGGRSVHLDLEDVLLRIKKGDEEEIRVALSELEFLITERSVGELGGSVIPVLLNRLGSGNRDNRMKIILVLRSLASHSDDNKERMSGLDALSSIVRSLARDVDERREAAGLLVDLLGISKVRQRIGRIQGCIVMLAALLNGDDPCAAGDARNLLSALSTNTQNVLLMVEAGYFVPLVQYLKEGNCKERIEGLDVLLSIMSSLARDVDECREAARLLVDLLGASKVRQRIGRIQGCIVMLAPLINGDDLCAFGDARSY